jgi:hypothetical protein
LAILDLPSSEKTALTLYYPISVMTFFFSLSLVDIIDVDSLRRDFFHLPAQPDASIYTPVACAFDFCFFSPFSNISREIYLISFWFLD